MKKARNMSLLDFKLSFNCIYIKKFVLDYEIIYIYIFY